MSRPYDYTRLTPDQFSAGLDQLDMTAEAFCALTGANYQRVCRMFKGTEDIPHWFGIVLCAMTVDAARDVVESYVDSVRSDREAA